MTPWCTPAPPLALCDCPVYASAPLSFAGTRPPPNACPRSLLLAAVAGAALVALAMSDRHGERHAKREYYRYQLKEGNRIVHRGITRDPARREREHRRYMPRAHLVRIGPRVSRATARAWERPGGRR